MRRSLAITAIIVFACIALLIAFLTNRNQTDFDAVKQSLAAQCGSTECRTAVENNFSQCIGRYKDAYRDNPNQHTSGMILCMDIPSGDYDGFNILSVENRPSTTTTSRNRSRITSPTSGPRFPSFNRRVRNGYPEDEGVPEPSLREGAMILPPAPAPQ